MIINTFTGGIRLAVEDYIFLVNARKHFALVPL